MSRKEDCKRTLENIYFPIINTMTEEIVDKEQKL